jgi:hypothetical protein
MTADISILAALPTRRRVLEEVCRHGAHRSS